MNDKEQWYQSRAVWGAIVAIIASIAGTKYVIPQNDVVELIMQIVAAIGGGIALYGRIKATKKIVKKERIK